MGLFRNAKSDPRDLRPTGVTVEWDRHICPVYVDGYHVGDVVPVRDGFRAVRVDGTEVATCSGVGEKGTARAYQAAVTALGNS